MEINTIIGIVVAIIICIVGLRMMLRKPNEAAPSLETELHINQDSNKPVIPRHVRYQLQTDSTEPNSSQRIEPSFAAVNESLSNNKLLNTDAKVDFVEQQAKVTAASETQLNAAESVTQTATQATVDRADTDSTQTHKQHEVKPQKEHLHSAQVEQISLVDTPAEDLQAGESQTVASNQVKDSDSPSIHPLKETEFSLNPNIQTAEIQDYEDESNILDVHLHEQQRFDDDSELARAEHIISLNLYPNPRKALSGDKVLKVLLKYGLRFGEMNCFHRYEHPEKVSPLMFSVLRITEEGPAGFDLEALSIEQVKGLAFFLALPHQNVQKGYDSMVSIAGLIARETDGTVYDENNLEFTPQLKEHWRHKAIDYRSTQSK